MPHCVHVLQPICLLVHLASLGFEDKGLEALLEHPNIIKVRDGHSYTKGCTASREV